MTATTSRSRVPFLMARVVAKNVSKEIKSEANDRTKKTMTAGRVRKMIANELHDRNQQTTAASYTGEIPENTQRSGPEVERYKSPIGSAETDQHNVSRANRDSALHDKSKRLASPARPWSNLKVYHLHRVT